jgi:hypothetical protein
VLKCLVKKKKHDLILISKVDRKDKNSYE